MNTCSFRIDSIMIRACFCLFRVYFIYFDSLSVLVFWMALFETFLQSVATRCSGISSVFRASIKSSNSISGFKYGLTNIYGVLKTNTGKPEITICF